MSIRPKGGECDKKSYFFLKKIKKGTNGHFELTIGKIYSI